VLAREPKGAVAAHRMVTRLTGAGVQWEGAPVLLNGRVMPEAPGPGYIPQEKGQSPMRLRKVAVQVQSLLHLDVSPLERGCVLASELTDPEPVGSRQLRMRGRETRIERHGPFQQPYRHGIVRPSLVPDPNL